MTSNNKSMKKQILTLIKHYIPVIAITVGVVAWFYQQQLELCKSKYEAEIARLRHKYEETISEIKKNCDSDIAECKKQLTECKKQLTEFSNKKTDLVFGVSAGGRVHIFQNESKAASAGLPDDAKIHAINSNTPIGTATVDLSPKTKNIQGLNMTVTYEYHADTNNSPAILEFAIKDKTGKILWKKEESYNPKQRKMPNQQEESINDNLKIPISESSSPLLIEVKPVSAGDFGFYISDLQGTLVVSVGD